MRASTSERRLGWPRSILLVAATATRAGAVVSRLRLRLQPRAAAVSEGRQLRWRRSASAAGCSRSVRREPSGSGWSTDYPDADVNFSIRLAELTKTRVSRQRTGDPNHLVVPLDDDWLFNCPYLHMEDVGTLEFSDEEVRARARLPAEGRLHLGGRLVGPVGPGIVGTSRSAACCRPSDYPIRRHHARSPGVPDDVPGHRSCRRFPSISHWRRSGGGTSERGADSAVPVIRGISDDNGNLMVLMTHNTDISDAWEREGEDPQYFYSFSPDGYAVGLNIVLYAMTH